MPLRRGSCRRPAPLERRPYSLPQAAQQGKFSAAELQCYLQWHKTAPDAVVGAWTQEIRGERRPREGREAECAKRMKARREAIESGVGPGPGGASRWVRDQSDDAQAENSAPGDAVTQKERENSPKPRSKASSRRIRPRKRRYALGNGFSSFVFVFTRKWTPNIWT
ncbi:hypothetical protein FB451DRAFT_659005 [Mycena latifolia]|nr:hypothetical protein FB451DRAFT_659005 [Mycena latifolia]